MNGRHDSIARLLFEVDTRPGVHQMCGEAVLHFWKQKEEKKTKQKKSIVNNQQRTAREKRCQRGVDQNMSEAILHFGKGTPKSIAISNRRNDENE